jgi:hypothetical protein
VLADDDADEDSPESDEAIEKECSFIVSPIERT